MSVDLEIVRRLVQLEPCELSLGITVDDLPGDWRCVFEERAAILEYDGGLSREEADRQALIEICNRMQFLQKDQL